MRRHHHDATSSSAVYDGLPPEAVDAPARPVATSEAARRRARLMRPRVDRPLPAFPQHLAVFPSSAFGFLREVTKRAGARVGDMGLFRRRRPDLATLLERRAQLLAEIEAVDADAAWTAVSDDPEELADSRSLRLQTDALRRALVDLDAQIAAAQERL